MINKAYGQKNYEVQAKLIPWWALNQQDLL